jgi:hypothetical protein
LGAARSRSSARRRLAVIVAALAGAVSPVASAAGESPPGAASAWLQPPLVLPAPSRSGPEGPPRPLGAEPPAGAAPSRTARRWASAQGRALLNGPFPSNALTRGISDGELVLSADPFVRAFAVSRTAATGAKVIRIPVDWRSVVVADPPAGFDERDPSSSAYLLSSIDTAVRESVAGGLQPLLVVSHAPSFAEAPHRWPFAYPGSWAPSPAALEHFAAALARRYDGTFLDPARPGRALPRVSMFQAWNEPNLPRYLEPQWIAVAGRWQAFSPALYRQMLNAFYAGVKSVAPADRVVAAGVAPNGDRAGLGRMAPITFLEGLFCLPKATQAKAPGCSDPPHFDVLAFHPLSVGNPDAPAASSLDVSIADAGKLTTLLRRAERLHVALPARRKPVWVTELNWESAPQSSHGVPPRLQAAWVSKGLHRLWVAGVQLVDWQFLLDPYPSLSLRLPTGATVRVSRPAGLYAAHSTNVLEAQPKQFLSGFTLPFDPLRYDRRRVRVWALLMHPAERAVLQVQRGGRWHTIARLRAGRQAVLNQLIPLRGAARLRLSTVTGVSATSRVGR